MTGYDLSKNGDLFLIDRIGRRIKVGKIEKDSFVNTDKDNYHQLSKSLGIDRIILSSKDLVYKYISFRYYGKTYITTRYYFINKAIKRNILNGRDMLFLEIKDMSLSKALRYEQVMRDQELAQLDIFDVLTDSRNTNNRLLDLWVETINK